MVLSAGARCEKFGFYDARGRPQRAGCMKALRTLEAESRISLPAAQRSLNIARPRLLDAPVAEPVEVPERVNQLQDLEIVCVRSAQDRAIWNTLMDREHPQGVTTFAGAQLRYLFKSAHGYLGAIGFSAFALYLKPRDAWMAWTDAQRSQMLYRVVNLSRFLIRPRVRCKNLASYLLGRVLRRLQADFQARYAYVPYLVETFVGPDQEGTCFKAANFRYLGTTQGRGRHAPVNVCTRSKKKVYVYELARDWREKLGVPHVELHPRLEVGAGLDGAHWAEQEFGGAQLGDRRRSARLVKSATLLAQTMGSPITAAPHWEPAAIRGFYRFIEKADELGITPKKILAPHRQRTIERMRTQEMVLCVQDGTDISYSTRPQCDGLEVIGRNQTTAQAQGVHLHATLALSKDGLPLGVLRCAYKKRKGAHAAKTQQWIDGLGDIEAAAQTLPRKTRVLCVMDREADVFAIFAAQRALKRTHVLVRVKVDRRLEEGEARLFKVMRRPPGGCLGIVCGAFESSREVGACNPRRPAGPPCPYGSALLQGHAACDRGRLARPGARIGDPHQRDCTAGRGKTYRMVPADHRRGDYAGTSPGDGGILRAALACGGHLPDTQERMQGGKVAHATGVATAQHDHASLGNGLAHHADDAAGSRGERAGSRRALHRCRAGDAAGVLPALQPGRTHKSGLGDSAAGDDGGLHEPEA